MFLNKNNSLAISTLAVLCLSNIANATPDVIIQPEERTIISTSYYTIVDAALKKAIDNSGLSFPLSNGAAVPSIFPTHNTTVADMYWSGSERTPTLRLALPGVFNVNRLHYWNFNQANPPSTGGHHVAGGTERGFKLVNISYSNDGLLGPYTFIGTYTLNEATGDGTYTGEDLLLGSTVQAHYIQMQVTSDWGGDFSGIAELRFIGQAVKVFFVGTVKLEGWLGAALPSSTVSVDGGAPQAVTLTSTGQDTGTFSVLISANSAHTIRFKPNGFLAQTMSVTSAGLPFTGDYAAVRNAGFRPGDTDNNNLIDDTDMLNVINKFLSTPTAGTYTDTNGDGQIDDADLIAVINNFLEVGAN